jgi:hypothetical protein
MSEVERSRPRPGADLARSSTGLVNRASGGDECDRPEPVELLEAAGWTQLDDGQWLAPDGERRFWNIDDAAEETR